MIAHKVTKEVYKNKPKIPTTCFDANPIGVFVLKAIRDKNGTIKDLSIKSIDKEQENLSRPADAGKLYTTEYGCIKKSGLFNLMLKAMETDKPEQTEYYYNDHGIDKWLLCSFVKTDNNLIATNMDITKRKQAELEKIKTFTILQQSEEIALIGSWEYNLDTGKFSWSDGMYHLFSLAKNVKAKPEVYLQYATTQSQFTAKRIVNYITSGTTSFEEILAIQTDNVIKTIRVKASVIYNAEKKPVSVIGVDMDITDQTKLKEEKEQLEGMFKKLQASQKQKILQSMLVTQEEERKRIAESLHNGLGQLLYGVKLSLEQLNFSKQKIDVEWLKEVKQTTDRLVMETIKESRRLSHELTPIILEELGLKDAISDICRQFGNSITINCQFNGLYHKTSKFIEIVVYRTIQELVTNIIKHARATEAIVKLHIDKKAVNLTVQDNGIGFVHNDQNTGIGLKTIKSKIKLLNGKLNITSESKKFTIVNISIPNVQD